MTASVYNSGGGWTVGSTSNRSFGPVDVLYGSNSSGTFNSQNQRTDLGTYDNNGNFTNSGAKVYDAWNRWVYDGSNTRSYLANGFLARITDSDAATDDSYCSAVWQVVEDQLHHTGGGLFASKYQYVWGLGYVDDLVLRDDSSTSGSLGASSSGLGERLYVQQDANFNVT